jgi:hypothetical protein
MNTTTLSNKNWPVPLALTLGKIHVEIPSFRDPRYIIWGCQILFFILGVEYLNFAKGYDALLVCLMVGGLADFAALYFTRGRLAFPQSGFVTATGVALLLEASSLWLFALAVLIGIASKYLFVIDKRHYFNPNTFGVVSILALFPAQALSFAPQWTGTPWMWGIVVSLGIILVLYARVVAVAVAWMAGYYLFGYLKVALGIAAPLLTYAVPSGTGFMLF